MFDDRNGHVMTVDKLRNVNFIYLDEASRHSRAKNVICAYLATC
jgi:hypothetical protein